MTVDQQPRPVRSLFLERHFPAAARRQAEHAWLFFVLEELNGLGDVLRLRDGKAAPVPAKAAAMADVRVRARGILETLGWDAAVAVAGVWAFVEEGLDSDEDAWGPLMVLRAYENDRNRVQAWVDNLTPEARGLIERTPRL